ncbi:MAG: DIP1984 family protein [Clostridia bacterium]|nr:DIP1984 family protein [Clostridia bacterium]
MKLAEALQMRADLTSRISSLRMRLGSNALVQEGEQPSEDPYSLLTELDACISQLEELITRINMTNCQTLSDGETLTALLARRDVIKMKVSAYRDLVNESSQSARRATRSEIKILPTVKVSALQKTIDELSKELRLLDNRIQQCNWTVDLL